MIGMNLHTLTAVISAMAVSGIDFEYRNEFKILPGHKVFNDFKLALPHTYIKEDELPDAFTWGNVDGKSYLTHSLNQHIPQYCGSCWAHGAISALGDRIKIARQAEGEDINLSVQYILNCGGKMAGSCHGGSASGAYEFMKSTGPIPYDTCQPYTACSSESKEGFCKHYDTKCTPQNTCKTCNTFSSNGGFCSEINQYPNATVSEYGMISKDAHAIKAEIFARGPVAAGIDAEPIVDYKGGIIGDHQLRDKMVNHIVSIVGWGFDEETGNQHWIVRNSWGQYWGEMGYFRVEMGYNALGLESEVSWATPGDFTLRNFPCGESGTFCGAESHNFQDPSKDVEAVKRRLVEARR
mmetsp:Transcript_31665/g.36576  ORF Transcript_31665/g.36576 Transcript_31665/m.36576 type:complete len:352 (+) Transcript_31665:82-1137(+)